VKKEVTNVAASVHARLLAANYNGVRIRCDARLGNARVAIQVDVGFGDVVTPGAQDIAPLSDRCEPPTVAVEREWGTRSGLRPQDDPARHCCPSGFCLRPR